MRFVLLFLLCCCFSFVSYAYDPKEGSGLPVPRFASIKSDNAFVRTGPSMDYPIKYIFKRAGLPIQIVQEFDAWRKVKDPDGDMGWVHKLLLSGKRTAMMMEPVTSVFKNNKGEVLIAELEKGVIVTLKSCDGVWCEIEYSHNDSMKEGWISQKNIWGIAIGEKLN